MLFIKSLDEPIYLVIVGSTIGKHGTVPPIFDGMNLTENAVRIIPHIVNKLYLNLTFGSNLIQEQFFDKTNQLGQPKLAIKRINSTFLPIPPLEEQKRIVAKVDEMMAMCDGLAARMESVGTVRGRLLDAVLG